MKTTITKLDRVLTDFTNDWPSHPNPFVGLPASAEEDLPLFLAAGVHPGDPPLPPTMTAAAARQLANQALADARTEAAAAMSSRLLFNQHKLDPAEVRELCDLPMPELARRFCDAECGLDSSDEDIRKWVREQKDQVLFWEAHHERLCQQPGGLANASLCTIRQVGCGFGMMAQAMLEPYWCDSADTTFVEFHDQVIAAMPQADFHYSGPMPDVAGEQDCAVAA